MREGEGGTSFIKLKFLPKNDISPPFRRYLFPSFFSLLISLQITKINQ